MVSTIFNAEPAREVKSKRDMVLQFNGNGTLLDLKGRFYGDLFVWHENVIDKTIFDLMAPDLAQAVKQSIEKALKTGELQSFEYEPPNCQSCYELKFVVMKNDTVLSIVSDVSAQKETEEKVSYLAYHDTLTKLPNRYLFNDRLTQAMAHADRAKSMIAVLFIDLDNFKKINDTLGHKAGDELLKAFADRLVRGLRVVDTICHFSPEEPMTARLGGDEFVLLLTDVKDIQAPAIVATRIFEMLSEPFILGSHEIFVTASIGIAVYPVDATNIDSLLINADVAMYEAKKQGKSSYRYYSESMNKCAFERFVVEGKLRRALAHNEFMLFYQPQVNIQTGKLIGVEALIRWLQPDLVLTRPGEFIPLAEQSGLIIQIGEWVLRAACEQNLLWQQAGLSPMLMTVNVSGIQFSQDNFVETVLEILIATGMDPQLLQLELTESTIMKDYESTAKKLLTLRKMGVRASIDDFGTGYSSLKYLKHFPLDTLKIDTSFVRGLTTSAGDQSIVNAIVSLAHNFNLKVVAEGVETREQLDFLRESTCEAVQGYFVCPPVNPFLLAEFSKKEKYL
jgi:diguanylate cyclase (GGDEF)-like protein